MNSRDKLARKQAALLAALLDGAAPPAGFDPRLLAVEVTALRAKRRNVIRGLRPDVAYALGERFTGLCDAYIVACPRRAGIRARQDADAFARWLAERGELPRPRRHWTGSEPKGPAGARYAPRASLGSRVLARWRLRARRYH